ncbi:HAD family hydrolase [Nesterenkonia lutea]|uniref:FMN phosphatase YigB (HAD superfamily) n=1 Tax=Nesterenkonia lutea TaxID=272919 RepID=A0ABR9JG47_9MICC|nr:HAD family hydrolase [Nesterenkonia lutea]MBE1524905.1 FMN phosphatase YigB (HAD superfamily) [Nesterenkonia lutea]
MTREKLLLLDFDGTLCLGDDPVLFYADRVDAQLAQRGLGGFFAGTTVREILSGAFAANTLLVPQIRYDAEGIPLTVRSEPTHDDAKAHPVSWPLQDGYQLVQLLARQAGLSDAESGEGFRAARKDLLAHGLEHTDVHAPSGARELVAEVAQRAVVVLVTNSPAEVFAPWLQALGLSGAFDLVINDARKPFGMPAALERARTAGRAGAPERPTDPRRVLSVGDIWRNDLEHVASLGGTTVLIDRFGTGLGEPDHRVEGFDGAAEAVSTWSHSAARV